LESKYREYFSIDEDYFPQINDYSIAAAGPDFWTRTYPHQKFIKILEDMERVLARQEKRSLWIEGTYGTGKSQCAYALKKILEVPEDELRAYWKKYEPLKRKTDLLEKLIGHKQKGIVTAHRYASGGINSPRELFFAIQESLKTALDQNNLYVGENTLKESVIAWIDEPAHKQFIDALLQKPEWSALFSQSNAEEVLDALRKGGEVKELMNNIFRLADKEGITALNIDADRLLTWITDVIDRNDVKIVLIWDEFSDYLKNNRESLSEFQKVVELVNLKPFYFVIVTHEAGQLFSEEDTTWKKVRDRFNRVEITLPDNIAFNLIGHAFNVKPAAKFNWDKLADDLNSRVSSSRAAVMKVAGITEQQVMKDIMPIHPMAALLLKNIASGFQSNQRSMFDFIKSSTTDDVKAFQWFIENTGPLDDHPLLTVDMLWDFFYEKGKENLTPEIRLILDTYPQQQNLREDEQRVLKAILIMQAIDQRLGGTIDLFKATEQNLSYVFEGISSGLDVSCKNIAKQLVSKGILVSNPIGDGRHVFVTAVLAGDQAKIDGFKKDIRQNSTTAKLVAEGNLANVLLLSPALRLRFESEPNSGKITPVTISDFTRTINALSNKPVGWKFQAVIAFAKDDAEAASFREVIKEAVANKQYKNIVIIDALSTPLGNIAFDQYVDHSAMAMYYSGNNNQASQDNASKAKRILDQDWKNRIYNGQFVVYSYVNQDGEKLGNGQAVASFLQSLVISRFPYAFDFTRGLTENQLKLTNAKASAKNGILQSTSGVMVNADKNVLPSVWGVDDYWQHPNTSSLPVSVIKKEVDELINQAFQREGQISIGEIYGLLEDRYGFAPCNLSAFLTGFLLKEYSGEPFRYADSSGGHEPMTPDKLAEMIGNLVGKSPKPTYIVKMTPEEMAFYELTERVWAITPNSCSSVGQAAVGVSQKMSMLGLPVWCLSEVDSSGVYDIVEKYIELIQREGSEAHKIAVEIGGIALARPTIGESLEKLVTAENCQKGMRRFLTVFEGGRIPSLATEIGAKENVLSDVRELFSVKHSCLWDRQTGENEIRKLITHYEIVKITNSFLNVRSFSLRKAFEEWQERLSFLGVSYEALREELSSLAVVLDILYRVYQGEDILFDQVSLLLSELSKNQFQIRELLNNEIDIFAKVYSPYLENLSIPEISEIKSKLSTKMFGLSRTECNSIVKATADEFRRNQLKTQLFTLWKDRTGTKTPREWSALYRVPILCCVPEKDFSKAKSTFDTLNNSWSVESEIKAALEFLQTTQLFEILKDEKERNAAFDRTFISEYRALFEDRDKLRNKLEQLAVDTYDWYENPLIKNKVKELAEAEYNAGGSDKALEIIDNMDDIQLKKYLKRLVKDNMTVGVEIILTGGK
jgi:uncharacterized protein YlaN (UPF0358 family)